MQSIQTTDLSSPVQEYASPESWIHHVYKLSAAKVKSGLSSLKSKWLHLNGDDPEVSKFGLVALVAIGLLFAASFYVSFLDGWFREFWYMMTSGGI